MKASELLLQSAEPFDAMRALVVEIPSDELRGKFNSLFAATAELFDPACMLVRGMELEIDQLRTALQLSTNDLRIYSQGAICEKRGKALMAQVIANEALLTHNADTDCAATTKG